MVVKIKYVGPTPIAPEVNITPGKVYTVIGWGTGARIVRDDGELYTPQQKIGAAGSGFKWEIVSVTEGGCADVPLSE